MVDSYQPPSLAKKSATPIGKKTTPIAKMAGMTLDAVSIGCHAGNFCCRNFVSANAKA